MSITPDMTRHVKNPICSKCGQFLYVNNQAIIHEQMHDGKTLVIGDCCADLFIGALIQDFSDALTKHSVSIPSNWLTSYPVRAKRIISALRNIADAYEAHIDPYALSLQKIKHIEG
jgi:hypothetical protein